MQSPRSRVAPEGSLSTRDHGTVARPSLPHIDFEREPGAASRPLPRGYQRRTPETTALYAVIRDNLETFLDDARQRSVTGLGYPEFIRKTRTSGQGPILRHSAWLGSRVWCCHRCLDGSGVDRRKAVSEAQDPATSDRVHVGEAGQSITNRSNPATATATATSRATSTSTAPMSLAKWDFSLRGDLCPVISFIYRHLLQVSHRPWPASPHSRTFGSVQGCAHPLQRLASSAPAGG